MRPNDGYVREQPSRVARLLEMLTLLQGGGSWNATDLAHWFGVSRTRIYNDIAVLRSVGIPIQARMEGYRLGEGFFMPALSLTLDEAAALFLQIAFPSFTAKRDKTLTGATGKLLASLPQQIRKQALLLGTRVRVTDGTSRLAPHATSQLLRSILEQRRVSIVGSPSEHPSTIDGRWTPFDPYGLIHDNGAWYVTGYVVEQRRVETLRVEDIKGVEPTPLHFSVPQDFRIDDHVSCLRITPSHACPTAV